jgi:hypothetical protein
MPMPPVPTGKGRGNDSFNDHLRADSAYRAEMRSLGVNPDAKVKLSGEQRAHMERWVRQKCPALPGKFQIDPAGNVNTDHGLSTAWSNPYFRTALIAGGTLGAGMAIAPAAFGLGAGGSAVAPTVNGITTALPGAVASQGVSAGVGAAASAAAATEGLGALVPLAIGQAGAQTAASIYNTRAANKTNQRAIEATERESNTNAQLERERLTAERQATQDMYAFEREREAAKERARQEAMAADRQRWQDYVGIHQPHWSMGAGVLGGLYDMAGVAQPSGGEAPIRSAPISASASFRLAPAGEVSGAPARPAMPPRRSAPTHLGGPPATDVHTMSTNEGGNFANLWNLAQTAMRQLT